MNPPDLLSVWTSKTRSGVRCVVQKIEMLHGTDNCYLILVNEFANKDLMPAGGSLYTPGVWYGSKNFLRAFTPLRESSRWDLLDNGPFADTDE